MNAFLLKKPKFFIFALLCLIFILLLACFDVSDYVLGVVLAAWTIFIFYFNFTSFQQTVLISLYFILALFLFCFFIKDISLFLQIIKYYVASVGTTVVLTIFYWMIKIKDEITNRSEKFK